MFVLMASGVGGIYGFGDACGALHRIRNNNIGIKYALLLLRSVHEWRSFTTSFGDRSRFTGYLGNKIFRRLSLYRICASFAEIGNRTELFLCFFERRALENRVIGYPRLPSLHVLSLIGLEAGFLPLLKIK
jgi:hypothetical protein